MSGAEASEFWVGVGPGLAATGTGSSPQLADTPSSTSGKPDRAQTLALNP